MSKDLFSSLLMGLSPLNFLVRHSVRSISANSHSLHRVYKLELRDVSVLQCIRPKQLPKPLSFAKPSKSAVFSVPHHQRSPSIKKAALTMIQLINVTEIDISLCTAQ